MSFAILVGIALSAASSPAIDTVSIHATTAQLESRQMAVNYHAKTQVKSRDINLQPANRSGTGGCRWSAEIQVDRQVSHAGGAAVTGLSKSIGAPISVSGIQPGMCKAARSTIASMIAARVAKMQPALTVLAQEDRAALMSEIEGIAALKQSTTAQSS